MKSKTREEGAKARRSVDDEVGKLKVAVRIMWRKFPESTEWLVPRVRSQLVATPGAFNFSPPPTSKGPRFLRHVGRAIRELKKEMREE